MAGYTGTPLTKKLGIKAGARVALVRAPEGFERELGRLPEGVRLRTQARGAQDIVLFFATRAGGARASLRRTRACGRTRGRTLDRVAETNRGVATDLREGIVRELGLAHGLVDNKVCAVDDTWSGLRFVYRLRDRASRNGHAR